MSFSKDENQALALCQRLGFRTPTLMIKNEIGIEVQVRTPMSIVIQRLATALRSQFWQWDGFSRGCTLLYRTSEGLRKVVVTNATNPSFSQQPAIFLFFDDRPLKSRKRPSTNPYPYTRTAPPT